MSQISRITTWTSGQTLSASALNGEFNNIVNAWNNTDSGTTAWTIVNSATFQKSGNAILTPMQVIQATTTTTFTTTNSTFQTTNLSASITPKSTSSNIIVMTSMAVNQGGTNRGAQLAIFRGSTNLMDATGGGQAFGSASNDINQVSMIYYDSPASTSSLTYAVKGLSTDGASTISFGNGRTQVIILMEVL